MSPAPAPATGLDFEPARLQSFLAEQLPQLTGELTIERIGGGQSNPTYFVTMGEAELVLRKRPLGDLVPSAHDVEREFTITTALIDTAVPVPPPILFCAEPDVLGTPFYLMERIHGRIFHSATLDDVPHHERKALYRDHARAMAALHSVDWAQVGLRGLARPGSFIERQIRRWSRAWGDVRAYDVEAVRDWLLANRPAAERQALVHGDFKFNNVIVHPREPKLVAVLDWELAGIGDPMFDLAHMWCATWATTPAEYGGVLGVDLSAQALPSAEDYFADYYAAADSPHRVLPFHRVLALLRYAGIFWGIYQRSLAGTATAANAAEQGATAHVYLDRALEIMATQ
jgi:aminoglycoside phosphotransferase (APT) family kinase protein